MMYRHISWTHTYIAKGILINAFGNICYSLSSLSHLLMTTDKFSVPFLITSPSFHQTPPKYHHHIYVLLSKFGLTNPIKDGRGLRLVTAEADYRSVQLWHHMQYLPPQQHNTHSTAQKDAMCVSLCL